jgi:hypothetical protein
MLGMKPKLTVETNCSKCGKPHVVDFSEFVEGTRRSYTCECGCMLVQEDAFKTLVTIQSILKEI